MRIKVFILAAFLFLSAGCVQAQESERIESFHSDINIEANGQVSVRETIQYFFPSPRHGIIRYIPVKYSVQNAGSLTGSYNIYLTVSSVNTKDENGTISAVPFEKSNKGSNINIKIGDPDREVSGRVTYVIDYRAQRAINFSPARLDDTSRSGGPKENEGQDEFYWNVTGNGWEVPIAASSAEIHFPVNIDANIWEFGCFTGPLGSEQKECSYKAASENSVKFESRWELPAREGLTIIAGFPKNIVKEPTASEDVMLALKHNSLVYLFLLIPVLAFIFLFVTWFLKGRDPEGKGTIIPFYGAPDGLTPIEMGTIVDEKADLKDISSSVIDLAVRGYLKIREVEKKSMFGIFKSNPDYEIQRVRIDTAIPDSEKKIFNAIFSHMPDNTVKLSDLQNTFPNSLSEIKETVYGNLVRDGYFPKSPAKVRNAYLFIGAVVAFLGIILFVNNLGLIGAGSMFLTGGMIALFGLFMPKKTIKGVNVYEKILGLKEYLSVAEADRIKFHNAPEKKPQHFERLLPYAMVLGVEKEWAKQFEGIYNQPPSWYEGTTAHNFTALYLTSSLTGFRNTANAAMGMRVEGGGASGGMSGFGGGGFSGGGFGGGGGSSW